MLDPNCQLYIYMLKSYTHCLILTEGYDMEKECEAEFDKLNVEIAKLKREITKLKKDIAKKVDMGDLLQAAKKG